MFFLWSFLQLKVVDGNIRKGDKVATYHSSQCYEVNEVGVLMPVRTKAHTTHTHTHTYGANIVQERVPTSVLTTGQARTLRTALYTPVHSFVPCIPNVQVGYMICGIKSVRCEQLGDTPLHNMWGCIRRRVSV